ncbi:MAG TPA: hypothetical protein PKC18_11345, partial [Lacipirellulaceae bacterium]|nr:hypothetical protein [Lacipirellulaceae bacterium]
MSTLLLLAGILQNIAAVRPMQLLVWASLVAASVFLVVSIRSRWGRSRPLYRCAALSLLVHFILIGVAMTVRLVVGDGGSGAGPPIRVRVIEELAEQGPVDPVERRHSWMLRSRWPKWLPKRCR